MDADPGNKPSDISQLVTQDLAGYQRLSDLLDTEKSLLIGRNFKTLSETLAEKQEIITLLDQISQVRAALLANAKLSNDEQGITSLFESLPADEQSETTEAWASIKALGKICHHKNEVNARITHRAQSTNRQILNILRGETASADLYDKAGKGTDKGSNGTIASA